MRKGFTLLELMIVVIIIGILASMGIVQYSATVEKTRSAEAKTIIGDLRTKCGVYYMEDSSTGRCAMSNLSDVIPATSAGCTGGYYFYYTVSGIGGNSSTFNAQRCTSGGKSPQAPSGSVWTVNYTANYATGVDTSWQSSPAGKYM